MADETPWAEPVVVPDDISSLQADVDAYHRELRHESRARWLHRLVGSRLWQQWAGLGGVVAGAFALSVLVFVVLTVGNSTGSHRAPAPVATMPRAAAGTPGGLLPDTVVRTESGAPVIARSLRPALIALVPLRCECAGVISSLAGQAAEVDVPLVVVAPGTQDAEVAALPGRTHRGEVRAVFDAQQILASTYRASGITVLVLAPDATVTYVQRDVGAGVRLEGQLVTAMTSTSSGGQR